MKPIEIHIEGYKIVISEDRDEKDKSDAINILNGKEYVTPDSQIWKVEPHWKAPDITLTSSDKIESYVVGGR